LQGFNRGQIAPKCVFPTDYALKPEKGCWLSGGKVNNYISGIAFKLNEESKLINMVLNRSDENLSKASLNVLRATLRNLSSGIDGRDKVSQ